MGELRYHGHFAICFYIGAVDFFPPMRTIAFDSVINSTASAPQGIILAFCGNYLCLKPGVSVGFDLMFNCKPRAVPTRLIMNLLSQDPQIKKHQPQPPLQDFAVRQQLENLLEVQHSPFPAVWRTKHLGKLEKALLNSCCFYGFI